MNIAVAKQVERKLHESVNSNIHLLYMYIYLLSRLYAAFEINWFLDIISCILQVSRKVGLDLANADDKSGPRQLLPRRSPHLCEKVVISSFMFHLIQNFLCARWTFFCDATNFKKINIEPHSYPLPFHQEEVFVAIK